MAPYILLASESTVQVLSPTVVNDVVYCTIQTSPSGVIASTPVSTAEFLQETVSTRLSTFEFSIETLMERPEVIAGTGTQTIDDNGLLADNVAFTVEYVPPNTTGTSVTAVAVVPVSDLLEPRATSGGGGGLTDAVAKITDTYNALVALAG